MITPIAQRWTRGRGSYRPAGETFDPSRFDVAPVDEVSARAFVVENHYSSSYPAARRRFGLYGPIGTLAGVAVFSEPSNPLTLACLPGTREERAELGRLVLLDDVRANGESWFIARCFDALSREGFVGAVAFSDPTKRTDIEGKLVFRGHVGTIYQATNAVYLGRSKAETRRLLHDGTIIHGRSLAKIRKRDRSYRYAVAILERHGATHLHDLDDPTEWLDEWLPKLTTPLKHAGNHKYAWTFKRRDRRHLPASLPYPKLAEAA